MIGGQGAEVSGNRIYGYPNAILFKDSPHSKAVDNTIQSLETLRVFAEIKALIGKSDLDSSEKSKLDAGVDEMEQAVNTPSFTMKYKQFMEIVHLHSDVLATTVVPAATALIQFLQ